MAGRNNGTTNGGRSDSAQALAAHTRGPRVELYRDLASLEPWRDEWSALANEAVEPNPFYSPWALIPAVRAFGGDLLYLVVLQPPLGPPRKGDRPLMTAFVPLEFKRASARSLLPSFDVWRHPHCFLTAPLLRRGYQRAALGAVLDWLEHQQIARGPVTLEKAPGDGPLHQLFIEQFAHRGWLSDVRRRYTRAVLRPDLSGDEYLRHSLNRKRRKEFRRQLKQLAGHGEVEVVQLPADECSDQWVDSFLELERRSWKGGEGTALDSGPEGAAFLREMVEGGHAGGHISFNQLQVGGRTVAAKLNLKSGDAAFAFKIAYDPEFARYSPGVLLELEWTRLAADDPTTSWADSCAGFDHPMIDHLWRERRTIENLTFSPTRASELVLTARMMLRLGKLALLGAAKK